MLGRQTLAMKAARLKAGHQSWLSKPGLSTMGYQQWGMEELPKEGYGIAPQTMSRYIIAQASDEDLMKNSTADSAPKELPKASATEQERVSPGQNDGLERATAVVSVLLGLLYLVLTALLPRELKPPDPEDTGLFANSSCDPVTLSLAVFIGLFLSSAVTLAVLRFRRRAWSSAWTAGKQPLLATNS